MAVVHFVYLFEARSHASQIGLKLCYAAEDGLERLIFLSPLLPASMTCLSWLFGARD